VSDEDRSDQEDRLKQTLSEILSRVYDDGMTVKALQITCPSLEESTYRIYYREQEDYEGGVVPHISRA
jgi:precorrin-4 methylase